MLVGYARVSTADQNLDLQIDALKKAGCEKIFRDTVSGAKTERQGLQEAFEYLRAGDTLVVWKLDRLGRSLKNLLEIVNKLKEKCISFKSLQEVIDTTTPTGQFFFHITACFAEFERSLIRERTKAGLEAARARGRKGGRKKAIRPEKFQLALELYNEKKLSVGEICQNLGIKRRTFYNYLGEYKNQTISTSHKT